VAETAKTRLIERISVQTSYDLLADQLRATILEGDLDVGDRLPSERELVDQTGLSRGSVREALRILEVEGLIRSRPGRYGGITVSQPDNAYLARFVGQFVRSRRMPLRTMQEARETIEPALARYAALNRTDDELERIRQLNDDLASPSLDRHEFARMNIEWHKAIADASHNELLAALLYAMSYGVATSTSDQIYDKHEIRPAVLRVHARVVEAIEARDGEAAFRRMERHVRASRAAAADREESEFALYPTDKN
jgi:GntR family transcriptional regulator, transcriptional repressor for pyruvate dehydrogenase complex